MDSAKLNSRKLFYGGALSFTSTILLICGYTSPEMWVDLNKWVFGIYATGNVASKMSTGVVSFTPLK